MNTKMLSGLILLAALSTACKSTILDLDGAVKTVTGQVQFQDDNGKAVVLSSSNPVAVHANFYGDGDKGGLTLTFANSGDDLTFNLDQDAKTLQAGLDAVNAHVTSANQKATLDLAAGPSETVHQTWTAYGTCVYWQGYQTVCDRAITAHLRLTANDRDGGGNRGGGDNDGNRGGGDNDGNRGGGDNDGRGSCYTQLQTIYGQAQYQYSRDGLVLHDLLKVTQSTGTVELDLPVDQTNTVQEQLTACLQ